MEDESTVWQGTSSQVRNLHIYILCALLCWLIVPIFYAIWKYLELRAREYHVTTQRIRIRSGVFSKRAEELELYRVKDHSLVEPFWQRLFGLGNIELATHDTSHPELKIEAVPDAPALRDAIRKNVEACRERRRVRVAEFE